MRIFVDGGWALFGNRGRDVYYERGRKNRVAGKRPRGSQCTRIFVRIDLTVPLECFPSFSRQKNEMAIASRWILMALLCAESPAFWVPMAPGTWSVGLYPAAALRRAARCPCPCAEKAALRNAASPGQQQRVVVLGGGLAGLATAYHLLNHTAVPHPAPVPVAFVRAYPYPLTQTLLDAPNAPLAR